MYTPRLAWLCCATSLDNIFDRGYPEIPEYIGLGLRFIVGTRPGIGGPE
jgi:hypothetical protein